MSGKDLLCVIWFSRQINTLIDMSHLAMVVLSFTFTLLHLRVILKSSWKLVFLAPLQAGYLPEADCFRNTRRSFTFDLLFLPSLPFINSHEKLCSLFYLTCLCLQWEKGVEPVSVPAICYVITRNLDYIWPHQSTNRLTQKDLRFLSWATRGETMSGKSMQANSVWMKWLIQAHSHESSTAQWENT